MASAVHCVGTRRCERSEQYERGLCQPSHCEEGEGHDTKGLVLLFGINGSPDLRHWNLGLTKLPPQSDELGAEKEGIPFDIVANDADLVIIAGSDTSKTVLSSLFYYLLCNREKLDKLREEVDRFYPPGESLSSKYFKFQEMSYLDACINETLRLAPPVPSGSQRDAGPNPDPSKGRVFGP